MEYSDGGQVGEVFSTPTNSVKRKKATTKSVSEKKFLKNRTPSGQHLSTSVKDY